MSKSEVQPHRPAQGRAPQAGAAGQENPIDTIHGNKFYEVAPNVTLAHHVYSPIPLTMSEKTRQKLSAADQAAIMKAGAEASAGIAGHPPVHWNDPA